MFRILYLLLGLVVLSEVDGTLASVSVEESSNFEEGKELQVPYISEDPYRDDVALQKRSSSDKLMRRSSLDKNFMRFGRSGFRERCCDEKDSIRFFEDTTKKRNSMPLARRLEEDFIRFGRSQSDNFMRFGRDDSFMRFGRDDSFMRFGRGDKDNFMRFGRGDKDNFMRFGRGNDNFMRFGRAYNEDSGEISRPEENFHRSVKNENFMRFGKNVKNNANFLRFGKSGGKDNSFIRFGRNGTNFLRFGRGYSEEKEKMDETDDTTPDASEGGSDMRRKRMIPGDTQNTGNSKMIQELPDKSSLRDQMPKPIIFNLSA